MWLNNKAQMTDEVIKWLLLLLITVALIILLISFFGGFQNPLKAITETVKDII